MEMSFSGFFTEHSLTASKPQDTITVRITAEEMAHYFNELALLLPPHLATTFLDEVRAHGGEWPTITRATNEIYPDPASWEQQCRCYEPGILHWEWADGGGFPRKRPGDE